MKMTTVIIAAVFITALVALFYLKQHTHGDVVDPPTGLEEEIRSHFKKSDRMVSSMTFYYCDGAEINGKKSKYNYSAIVKLFDKKDGKEYFFSDYKVFATDNLVLQPYHLYTKDKNSPCVHWELGGK